MTLGQINQLGRRKMNREDIQLPPFVEKILNRMANEISEQFEDEDPDRTIDEIVKDLDKEYGDIHDAHGRGAFNIIPSSSKWKGCTELLITFCYNNDSFEKRLRESLDHFSQQCRNTKDIYFITTKWNSTVFEKFEGYLKMVRTQGVNVVFIYLGKEGFVMMPE